MGCMWGIGLLLAHHYRPYWTPAHLGLLAASHKTEKGHQLWDRKTVWESNHQDWQLWR